MGNWEDCCEHGVEDFCMLCCLIGENKILPEDLKDDREPRSFEDCMSDDCEFVD